MPVIRITLRGFANILVWRFTLNAALPRVTLLLDTVTSQLFIRESLRFYSAFLSSSLSPLKLTLPIIFKVLEHLSATGLFLFELHYGPGCNTSLLNITFPQPRGPYVVLNEMRHCS